MDPDPDLAQQTVEVHHGPAVLKAWAPWCSSCRALGPVVEEIAVETGTAVVPVQVDTNPEIVDRFAIRSVPTLIALNDGAEVGRLIGLQSGEAVRSLFDAAADSGVEVRPRTPSTLVAIRTATALVLILAGLVTGSVVLVIVGTALALWALAGLIWP